MMPSIAYHSAGPAKRRQPAFQLLTAAEPICPILSVGLSQWIALVTSGDTLDRLRWYRSNPVTFITFPAAQLPPWTKTTAIRLRL